MGLTHPPWQLLLACLVGMLAMFVMLFGDLVVGRMFLAWLGGPPCG